MKRVRIDYVSFYLSMEIIRDLRLAVTMVNPMPSSQLTRLIIAYVEMDTDWGRLINQGGQS